MKVKLYFIVCPLHLLFHGEYFGVKVVNQFKRTRELDGRKVSMGDFAAFWQLKQFLCDEACVTCFTIAKREKRGRMN